jgi:hypothetical protein
LFPIYERYQHVSPYGRQAGRRTKDLIDDHGLNMPSFATGNTGHCFQVHPVPFVPRWVVVRRERTFALGELQHALDNHLIRLLMPERGFPLFTSFPYSLGARGGDETTVDEDGCWFCGRVVRGALERLDELGAGGAFVDSWAEENGWVEEVALDEDSTELKVW